MNNPIPLVQREKNSEDIIQKFKVLPKSAVKITNAMEENHYKDIATWKSVSVRSVMLFLVWYMSENSDAALRLLFILGIAYAILGNT